MNSFNFRLPDTIILKNVQDFHTHLRGDLTDKKSLSNTILEIVVTFQKQFSKVELIWLMLEHHQSKY